MTRPLAALRASALWPVAIRSWPGAAPLDERLTSVEARRALRDAGVPARKQRGRVDPIAAALVLRSWLDRESAR